MEKMVVNRRCRVLLASFVLALGVLLAPEAMAVLLCGQPFEWLENEPGPVDIGCVTGDVYVANGTANLIAGGEVTSLIGMGACTINIYGGTIAPGHPASYGLNFVSASVVTVYAASAEVDMTSITDGQGATTNDAQLLQITETYIKNIGPSTVWFDLVGAYQDQTPFVIPCALETNSVLSLNIPQTAPEIVVYPALLAWDFGNIEVGQSAPVTVEIYNNGTADLNVSSVTLTDDSDAAFTITGPATPLIIAPSTSIGVEFEVAFAPSAAGPFSAVVEIESDDADEPLVEVSLSGTGVVPAAPEIKVLPETLVYDFGDVELDQSATYIVQIFNYGSADLYVSSVALIGDPAFTFTSGPAAPLVIAPNTSVGVDYEITFTPSAEGLVSTIFQIVSDDGDESVVEVLLQGVGIAAEVTPIQQIQAILDYFDASAAAGTLQGYGPGNSPKNRLKALRNMIEAAGDLINAGAYDQAADQLCAIEKKIDGVSKPQDFAVGEAVAELHTMVEALIADLTS